MAHDRRKWCRGDRSVALPPLSTIDVRMIGRSGAGTPYPALSDRFW
jgi:hypothetical protein